MKMSSLFSAVFLLLAASMLSGCIFPYWGDEDRGEYHGGYRHHDEGYRGDGYRGGDHGGDRGEDRR